LHEGVNLQREQVQSSHADVVVVARLDNEWVLAGWEGRQDAGVDIKGIIASDGLDKTFVNRDQAVGCNCQ
jgi:hypothetical protein